MQKRKLGKTSLTVSRLGIGLAEIGFAALSDDRAGEILNIALDAGITFLDTAAVYNISEDLIGRTVAHRRNEYVLATKCGNVAEREEDRWTGQTVTANIERSLKRLHTDHLDLVQLHSCSLEVLQQGEVIEALKAAQQAGKTRYIGYSGDNEAALWAVESGYFDTLQTSFNLVEQRARFKLFDLARQNGVGVIIKRPIANGAWGAETSPSDYADTYFERAQKMSAVGPLPNVPQNRILLALGFTLAHNVVDTAIVGTQNPAHLQANIAMVENDLPIPEETVTELHRRYEQMGLAWPQLT